MANEERKNSSMGRAIASFALALVVSLVVWEFVSRNYLFYTPEPRLYPDGSQYTAGRMVRWKEGYSQFSFSSDGYREPVPQRGKHNVLVEGDSFVQASQISNGNTFPEVAQRNLTDLGASFYNAGSSGLSPTAYLGLAPYFNAALKQDATVITLNTGDFHTDRLDRSRVYYVDDTGSTFELKKEPSHATGVLGPKSLRKLPGFTKALHLLNRSSIFQTALASLTKGPDLPASAKKKKGAGNSDTATVQRYVRWCVTELKKAYPGLVILYLPTVDYFDPTKPPPDDELEIARACAEEGVPLVNPRKAYLEEFQRTGRIAHGFYNTTPGEGHINEIGHRIAGEELAKKFREIWSRAATEPAALVNRMPTLR